MTSPPWPLSWPSDAPAYERAQALVARSDRVGDLVDQALDDIENDALTARRASVVAADGTAYWAVLIVVGAETVVIYWRKRESDASHYIAYVGPPTTPGLSAVLAAARGRRRRPARGTTPPRTA